MNKIINKISILIIVGTCWCASLKAQQLVFDPVVTSTLIKNHTAQQAQLSDIKTKTTTVAQLQLTVASKLEVIKQIEQKVYDHMRSVGAVIRQAKAILYAKAIMEDVYDYQRAIVRIAADDPELTIIALQTQIELLNRAADIFGSIATLALNAGEVNLMNTKERWDVINKVVTDLRQLRGLAYGIYRRMRTAQRMGLIAYLNPLNRPNSISIYGNTMINDMERIFSRN